MDYQAALNATLDMQALKPVDYKYGGNCGVLAVAICAGVSFEKAKEACRLRKGSKGGTSHAQREEALKRLGVSFESRAHGHHSFAKIKTMKVSTFARDWTVPGAVYMLRVSHHVVTVRDGIVMDQNGVSPAATHWTRNKIVTRSTRIL